MLAGFAQVIVGVAWLIVNALLPFEATKPLSPPKLALTYGAGYVPTLIPARLTLFKVAVPLGLLVVAVPTTAPFRLKVIVLPLTPEPPDVSVAERLVVPP